MTDDLDKFINVCEEYIEYWDKTDKSSKEKMRSFLFSILVILDGMSCSFTGDIFSLAKISKFECLHERFREKEKNDE